MGIPRLKVTHRDAVQFLAYIIGGTSYFWIGYLVFAACYGGLGWDWLPAKMAADLLGWSVNYLIQRYWAFASPRLRKHEGVTAGKYAIITAVNFGLDYLIIWSLKSMGVSPYAGFFISAGFFTAWNYVWYKLWVFYVKGSKAKEVV